MPGRKLFVDLGRVLYIGTWFGTTEHTAMVPIFGAGLDGNIDIQFPDSSFVGRSTFVQGGVPRTVQAFGGRLAVMVFDPSRLGMGSVDEPAALDSLVALSESTVFDEVAWNSLSSAVGLRLPELERVDTNVRAACAFIENSKNENLPGAVVAEAVGYSLSRLQDLFREQLGVSMRSYRNWSRLRRIAELMDSAPTLTNAAVEAGFFDAAHFTNTFVATFGVTPSEVFTEDLQIHVLGNRLA